MKNNISLLVGLKNNLEYSKNFYHTTRALYPDIEIVFTSYNSTDGTHIWLDSLTDTNVKYFYAEEEKTFSDTYNKCIALATKKYVAFAHNDMVLAPGFIESLEEAVTEEAIIAYTTVEPPIFAGDERPGKIIKDFGADIQSLNIPSFYNFAQKRQGGDTENILLSGTTFFLCLSRKQLLVIGGLDPLFNPMFCEDDDLIIRLELLGLKKYVNSNAICYHFVSKTSRFSEEYQNRTKQIEINSNKNFFRKWGFSVSSVLKRKYDIGFVVKNGNEASIKKLEPLCSTIYIDGDYTRYIKEEQPNTKFNLSEKIRPFDAVKKNDILIYLDTKKLKEESFKAIESINELVDHHSKMKSGLVKRLWDEGLAFFKKDDFKINIGKLKTYEHTLIKRI